MRMPMATAERATLPQMERVRAPTWGGALRGAKTHPDPHTTLGAHVVGVLPPPAGVLGLRGVEISGQCVEPVVVHAEATQRARVALLSACGLSVGYHGGWNAIIAFWSRPPDLCSCWRIRWPVGPRRPVRHGEVPGVLISILC